MPSSSEQLRMAQEAMKNGRSAADAVNVIRKRADLRPANPTDNKGAPLRAGGTVNGTNDTTRGATGSRASGLGLGAVMTRARKAMAGSKPK